MNPKKLLSLLTARVQRFHLAPGGIPALTPEDVAAALGMIKNDEARLYARVKYAAQYAYAEGVALAIRRRIMIEKLEWHWRISRKEFLLDMSYLILAESIDPHLCASCGGRESITLDKEGAALLRGAREGQTIACLKCNGSGRRGPLRDYERAELMETSRQNWHQNWSSRYKEAKEITVDKWESMFAGALAKRVAS